MKYNIAPVETVRLARAIRERHGWSFHRIGKVLGLPWRTVADFVNYATRKGAGHPGEEDLSAARRIVEGTPPRPALRKQSRPPHEQAP